MGSVLIGSVSSTAAALRGFVRGGLPLAGVCALGREHAAGVSDFVDLEPLAREARVSFISFRKVADPQVLSFLKEVSPDWIFVIGLSQLLPLEIREQARRGAVGFHPTLLPEGRGRAPVAWTILKQRPAASNLFFLTDEADSGDMIDQRVVPLLPDDYAADLIARTNDVLEAQCAGLSPAFASGVVPRTPQDHSRATWYPRRRPEDGRIDWHQPADAIYRLIRAVSHPYPGAFTYHQGRQLIVWRAVPVEAKGGAPGTVVAVDPAGPIVQAASGGLRLTDMEWRGGEAVPLVPGDVLA